MLDVLFTCLGTHDHAARAVHSAVHVAVGQFGNVLEDTDQALEIWPPVQKVVPAQGGAVGRFVGADVGQVVVGGDQRAERAAERVESVVVFGRLVVVLVLVVHFRQFGEDHVARPKVARHFLVIVLVLELGAGERVVTALVRRTLGRLQQLRVRLHQFRQLFFAVAARTLVARTRHGVQRAHQTGIARARIETFDFFGRQSQAGHAVARLLLLLLFLLLFLAGRLLRRRVPY